MKHFIYILVIQLLFACGSSKKTNNTEQSVNVEQNYQQRDSSLFNQSVTEDVYAEKQTDKQENEDVKVTNVQEKYDKDGNLVERNTTTIDKQKKSTDNSSEKQNQNKLDNKDALKGQEINAGANASGNAKGEVIQSKQETTVPKQIGWATAGIALTIISCIIAWLVYKKRNK